MSLMARALAVLGILLMAEDLVDGEVSTAVRLAIGVFLALELGGVLWGRTPR